MTTPGDFDVFLSYNSKDKDAVVELATKLKDRSLNVWLDEWEIEAGQQFQKELGKIIDTVNSAAVFIGKDGIGPWEDLEMQAFLRECVDREMPLIPVLLPGAPEKPELPAFLRAFSRVDLRGGFDKGEVDRLVRGIETTNASGRSGVRDVWVQLQEMATEDVAAQALEIAEWCESGVPFEKMNLGYRAVRLGLDAQSAKRCRDSRNLRKFLDRLEEFVKECVKPDWCDSPFAVEGMKLGFRAIRFGLNAKDAMRIRDRDGLGKLIDLLEEFVRQCVKRVPEQATQEDIESLFTAAKLELDQTAALRVKRGARTKLEELNRKTMHRVLDAVHRSVPVGTSPSPEDVEVGFAEAIDYHWNAKSRKTLITATGMGAIVAAFSFKWIWDLNVGLAVAIGAIGVASALCSGWLLARKRF